MNIIEQMYKEYGVKPISRYFSGCKIKGEDCKCQLNCDFCINSIHTYNYPPFTAEKQIELIKLLSLYDLNILQNSKGSFFMDVQYEYAVATAEKPFEDVLASCVIASKPFIDTSKVKEILEK